MGARVISKVSHISETIASRTAFSRPLARSSIPAVTLGIGCSDKPDAFDPCVPIPGSNGSAINQVGMSGVQTGPGATALTRIPCRQAAARGRR